MGILYLYMEIPEKQQPIAAIHWRISCLGNLHKGICIFRWAFGMCYKNSKLNYFPGKNVEMVLEVFQKHATIIPHEFVRIPCASKRIIDTGTLIDEGVIEYVQKES